MVDPVREFSRVLCVEGKSLLDCAGRLLQGEKAEHAQKQVQLALGYFQDSLSRGGKIVVTGVGKSGKIAQKIAATFCSTGTLAVFLHPAEALHGDLGLVRPEDAVLALSYTGNTDELVRLLPSMKNLKVPIVGLGGNSESKLASQCDAWIDGFVEQEACPHDLTPTASTTLALALGDALAITLMQLRGFTPQSFAANHPGGSLGRKLNLKVSEIMHQGSQLALVSPSASMDDVVIASTQKKLGAVLVVEGERLLGIITDGDLRRALRHREKFFQLKAVEVMTRDPVKVSPETLAKAALDLMENRSSQISVLPVVEGQGRCVGLVRLHDLVTAF